MYEAPDLTSPPEPIKEVLPIPQAKPEPQTGLGEYLKTSNYFQFIPKDQYGHATYLIAPERKDVTNFNELLNKDLYLAFIGSDQYLLLAQKDIHILTQLYNITLKEPGFSQLFKSLYTSFRGELALTRARDGKERELQAFPKTPQKSTGFGKTWEKDRKQAGKPGEEVVEYVSYQ